MSGCLLSFFIAFAESTDRCRASYKFMRHTLTLIHYITLENKSTLSDKKYEKILFYS